MSTISSTASPLGAIGGATESTRPRSRRSGRIKLVVGLLIVGTYVVLALLAPWLTSHDPTDQDILNALLPPSPEHPLGTD